MESRMTHTISMKRIPIVHALKTFTKKLSVNEVENLIRKELPSFKDVGHLAVMCLRKPRRTDPNLDFVDYVYNQQNPETVKRLFSAKKKNLFCEHYAHKIEEL